MRPLLLAFLPIASVVFATSLAACAGAASPAPASAPPSSSASVVATVEVASPSASPSALECGARAGRYGCTDRASGDVVIPFAFDEPVRFSAGGVAEVRDPAGWYYVDRKGARLFDAYLFDNGPDPVAEGLSRFRQNGKIGFKDARHVVVIPATYDAAMGFQGGRAKVCIGCDPKIWSSEAPKNPQLGQVFEIDPRGRPLP
jgi:hypothetical protein